jgi:GT2 family glycosyltransferase
MTTKPELSIVIVSSKKDFLFDCLKSLSTVLKGYDSEVIFVDNASADNLKSQVNKMFPDVKVIRREVNGGFGENNNMGMRIAKGRYVLLLNDDTKILDKNIFKEMIAWMDEHPSVGITTCALANPDLKNYQGSGGYFPTLGRVFAWMTFLDDIPGIDNLIKPYHPFHGSSFYTNEGYFKKPHKQDWVTGAYFLMRKEAMDEAGLFDEDFFLYVEEVELALRFAEKGWEAWYLPNWKIVHYGMSTNGSEKATIFEMQNLKLLYKKHYPAWQLSVLNVILKVGIVLRIVLYSLLKPSVAKIYAKALTVV